MIMLSEEEVEEGEIRYEVERKIVKLVDMLEEMHVKLKTNKTYFEMVSDVVRFSDLFTFLYTLLPDHARDSIDTAVGKPIPQYLSYKLTVVRGAGDKLIFQVKVGNKEGIEALNELIDRCTKAFYALMQFIRNCGYEFGI